MSISLTKEQLNRLEKLGISIPEIHFPNDSVNLEKWAVIACDQYTSNHQYWNETKEITGSSPSTLNLIFPEIYLNDSDSEERIQKIRSKMEQYLRDQILNNLGPQLWYVERETSHSGLRSGLMLAFDLEQYDYAKDSNSLIRATEGTILDRLPPRVKIRKGALLELPHIMILIDDEEKKTIETLEKKKDQLKKVYDISLMQGGGELRAYSVETPELIEEFIKNLEVLANGKRAKERFNSDTVLLFAMGDGNHSLATAKQVWEQTKEELRKDGISEEELQKHPARWALAELVNLYSDGLQFEPIHRAVFGVTPEWKNTIIEAGALLEKEGINEAKAQELITEESMEQQRRFIVFDGQNWNSFLVPEASKAIPPGFIDATFSKENLCEEIDFIHGFEETKRLAEEENTISVFLPVIARNQLFRYVVQNGPLPRKAFSMGEAEEKRYYVESRRILPDLH